VSGKLPESILSTMMNLGEDLKEKERREKDSDVFRMKVLALSDGIGYSES
jgi:hypothetical protein